MNSQVFNIGSYLSIIFDNTSYKILGIDIKKTLNPQLIVDFIRKVKTDVNEHSCRLVEDSNDEVSIVYPKTEESSPCFCNAFYESCRPWEGNSVLAQFHTHPKWPARFSLEDDRNDTSPWLYAVIGGTHYEDYHICIRIGCFGDFRYVSCEDVFGISFENIISQLS